MLCKHPVHIFMNVFYFVIGGLVLNLMINDEAEIYVLEMCAEMHCSHDFLFYIF